MHLFILLIYFHFFYLSEEGLRKQYKTLFMAFNPQIPASHQNQNH